jgi:hypothetical protein
MIYKYLLLSLATMWLLAEPLMALQGSSCLGPDDESSAFVDGARATLGAPGNTAATKTAAANIVLVTASATCDSAVAAYNRAHNLTGSNAVTSLYVAEVPGKTYVVRRADDAEQDWYGPDWKRGRTLR